MFLYMELFVGRFEQADVQMCSACRNGVWLNSLVQNDGSKGYPFHCSPLGAGESIICFYTSICLFHDVPRDRSVCVGTGRLICLGGP